jgi:hypothetical protein
VLRDVSEETYYWSGELFERRGLGAQWRGGDLLVRDSGDILDWRCQERQG